MVHWSFILGEGWLLSNINCKACQNCLRPSFVIVHNTERTWRMQYYFVVVRALANAITRRKQGQLGQKTVLTCFTNLTVVQLSMAEYE